MFYFAGLAAAWSAAFVMAAGSPAPTTAQPATPPESAEVTTPKGCMSGAAGYLRARARGAVDLDIDWSDAEIECEGGPRPSGNGIRVSIGGPSRGDGRRIRMVFGIAGLKAGTSGQNLRTNLTIFFEGEKRVFATRGDDKCTVDSLSQERVGSFGEKVTSYRVVARGFCIGPATSLSREERLVLTSFDFAGRVDFEDEP